MPNNIELLMPYGEPSAKAEPAPTLAPRLKSLAGMTIGVLWNGWHCMEVMQDQLAELLVRDFGAREVIGVQTGTTMPMSPAQLADARKRWDGAIVGLAM